MTYCFVSYVRADSERVIRLCDSLKEQGINIWLDREEIQPGQLWKQAISEAIRQGKFFLACFSSAYWDKERTYMNEELALAIEELRLRRTDGAWFIPVLLDRCDVPDISIRGSENLRDLQWVDLSNDWEAGIDKIAGALKRKGEGVTRALAEGAIEALRYKQQAIRDYADYPSSEFKQAQLKKVETDIAALKAQPAVRSPVSAGRARTGIRFHRRTEVGGSPIPTSQGLRVVKLPKGQGEVAVPNKDILTGSYVQPWGLDLCKVELNGQVFTVSNGLGLTFAPKSKVLVAKWQNKLLLVGLAGSL